MHPSDDLESMTPAELAAGLALAALYYLLGQLVALLSALAGLVLG